MSRRQGILAFIVLAAASFVVSNWAVAQPAPNNCGLNMLCRIKTLIVSGDTTMSGDLAVGDDLTVTDDAVIGDDALVTTLSFAGGGTPCLTRGGNTTVQTCSGDGLASLSTLQGQASLDIRGGINNAGNGANCSGRTGDVCIEEDLAGSNAGTTTWQATKEGLISGDVPVTSGAFTVSFLGGAAVAEGANGLGGLLVTTIGRSSKVGTVCCSCRVAGAGGTNGVFVSIMENTVEIASVEISAADGNACDDAAGTLLCGNLSTPIVATAKYQGQVKSSTDCATNPIDCTCDYELLR